MGYLINPYAFGSFPSGAVGSWKLDGDSTDATGTQAAGTDTSITYNAGNGIIIQGAGFNGTTSNINIADSTSLSIAGNMSVNFWVKIATQPGTNAYSTCVVKGNNNQFAFYYRDNGGTKQFESYIFADNTVTNYSKHVLNQSLTTGSWYMITWLVTPANAIGTKFETYLNGATLGNGTNTNIGAGCTVINDSTGALRFGKDLAGNNSVNGALDEITIWNKVLTAAEITTLYNGGAGIQYS